MCINGGVDSLTEFGCECPVLFTGVHCEINLFREFKQRDLSHTRQWTRELQRDPFSGVQIRRAARSGK